MLRFLLPKDKSAQGPAQRDSSLKISAEDGLDVLVGNSACSFSATLVSGGSVSEGCFRGVFQRGVSAGCFRGCFRPLGGSPERFCVMYPGGNFVKIPPPEGQIGPGTSTERFLFENQCRRWPRRPCGQLGMFISSDDVGKTLFPGGVFQRGVSEGCFRGVFQTPWLEGPPRAG